jgi:H+/Cl- antiporter ClcA
MTQRPSNSKEWPLKLFIAGVGIATAMFGVFEIKHGIFWHTSFNERFGRVGFTPALGFIALGLLFFLIGVLPWRQISDWLERRESRRKR